MANSPLFQIQLLKSMISAAELCCSMRKTTNLDDISIFVAVAEAGTFSAAATRLQLPASTISGSLTRLEKNMDLLLVRRSQRGLALPAISRGRTRTNQSIAFRKRRTALLSAVNRNYGDVFSGRGGGRSRLKLGQQFAKIIAGESPLEWRSGLLIALLKIHETVLQVGKRGKIVWG